MAISVLILAAPTSEVRADTTPIGQAAADLQAASTFREAFGLPHDARSIAIAAATGSAEAYGVPLTAADQANMDRRVAIQDALGPMQDFVAANSDVFGGLWLDQLNNARIMLEATPNAMPFVAKAESLAPSKQPLSSSPSVGRWTRSRRRPTGSHRDSRGWHPPACPW